MFLDFSLSPGGAFVMHEGASEYDPNVVVPVQAQSQAVKAGLPDYHNYDPVMRLLNATRPVYDKLTELSSINLEPELARGAVCSLDGVSETATLVVNHMRCCLIKQRAMSTYINNQNVELCFESFLANAATLLKHREAIFNTGYDKAKVETRYLSGMLGDMSAVRGFRSYILAVPGMPEFPITIADIRMYSKCDANAMSRFSSIGDMFQCLYHDSERLVRLEEDTCGVVLLDEMFDRIAWNNDACRISPCKTESVYAELIRWMSTILRLVKRNAYNMQCEILESDRVLSIEHFHKTTRAMISAVYDTFIWPMLIMLSTAYNMRQTLSYKKCIDRYVDEILTKIKNREL